MKELTINDSVNTNENVIHNVEQILKKDYSYINVKAFEDLLNSILKDIESVVDKSNISIQNLMFDFAHPSGIETRILHIESEHYYPITKLKGLLAQLEDRFTTLYLYVSNNKRRAELKNSTNNDENKTIFNKYEDISNIKYFYMLIKEIRMLLDRVTYWLNKIKEIETEKNIKLLEPTKWGLKLTDTAINYFKLEYVVKTINTILTSPDKTKVLNLFQIIDNGHDILFEVLSYTNIKSIVNIPEILEAYMLDGSLNFKL